MKNEKIIMYYSFDNKSRHSLKIKASYKTRFYTHKNIIFQNEINTKKNMSLKSIVYHWNSFLDKIELK